VPRRHVPRRVEVFEKVVVVARQVGAGAELSEEVQRVLRPLRARRQCNHAARCFLADLGRRPPLGDGSVEVRLVARPLGRSPRALTQGGAVVATIGTPTTYSHHEAAEQRGCHINYPK
jgi:hypothetical protein